MPISIAVTEYDPAWVDAFEQIRAELAEALRSVPIDGIEHIGSTAIPGLAAKPIIDVDVLVAAPRLGDALAALEAVGYEHQGDLGIPQRHALAAPPHGPERHVYVVVSGSLAARNHLGVRDVLRDNPDLCDRYAELKLHLGSLSHDSRTDYMLAKTELLHEMMAMAGLSPDEIAEIDGHTQRSVPLIQERSATE